MIFLLIPPFFLGIFHGYVSHNQMLIPMFSSMEILQRYQQRSCGGWAVAKSESPVDRWFIHPIMLLGFQHVSTIKGAAGFRDHPQYVYKSSIQ